MNRIVITISVILHIPPEEVGKRYSLNQAVNVFSDCLKTYREINIGSGFLPGLISPGVESSSEPEPFREITEDMDGDDVMAYYQSRKTDLSTFADILPHGSF